MVHVARQKSMESCYTRHDDEHHLSAYRTVQMKFKVQKSYSKLPEKSFRKFCEEVTGSKDVSYSLLHTVIAKDKGPAEGSISLSNSHYSGGLVVIMRMQVL